MSTELAAKTDAPSPKVFPAAETFRAVERKILTLPLKYIFPDPNNPRSEFDLQKLQDLAGSIRALGQQMPIIVRRDATRDGYYIVIDGHRRLLAAPIVPRDTIDALVVEGPIEPGRVLLIQLSVALTNEKLSPFDTADAFQTLMKIYDIKQNQLSEMLGNVSEAKISKILKVKSDLAPSLRPLVESGDIPFSYSEILAGVPDKQLQVEIGEKIRAGLLKRPALQVLVKPLIGKAKAEAKLVTLGTPKGVKIQIPQLDGETLLGEMQTAIAAVRRAMKHKLPIPESLPNLMQ